MRKGKITASVISAAVICLTAVLLIMGACGLRGCVMNASSMEPEIRQGALCFVNTRADYGEGDVIALETTDTQGNGITVISRVEKITEAGIETRGDANAGTDGIAVPEENVMGRVAFSVPALGRLANALKNTVADIIIYAAVIALIAFILLFKRKSEGDAGEKAEPEGTGYEEGLPGPAGEACCEEGLPGPAGEEAEESPGPEGESPQRGLPHGEDAPGGGAGGETVILPVIGGSEEREAKGGTKDEE